MLVLTRRIGEEIVIGDKIRLRVTKIEGCGRRVYIGIDAPRQIPVHRVELVERQTLSPIPFERREPAPPPRNRIH